MARRVVSPVFVGREKELRRLDAALSEAIEGTPTFVLLGGEAGIGKTRLVAEWTRRLDGAARVLIGGCVDLGHGGFPYAPFVEAFRPLADGSDAGRADEWGAELAAMGGDFPARGPGEVREGGQSRLFAQCLRLVGSLAHDLPVVLVLEDLHWADQSTRDLVRWLARNLRDERLVVVTTYREDEVGHRPALRGLLAELARLPNAERFELQPLHADGVAAQLAAIHRTAVTPSVAARIAERSEGIPFFVEELAAAFAEGDEDGLPPALRDMLLARIERLDEAGGRVVRIAAVAGRAVSHRLLEAVADVDNDVLVAGLRDAVAHEVLRVASGDDYAFRHALLQEATRSTLIPADRIQLHRRFARALTDDPHLAPSRAAAAVERAYHWHAAGETGQSFRAAIDAGLASEAVFAFADARLHYQRAAELWDDVAVPAECSPLDRAALLERAAQAAFLSGDLPAACTLARRCSSYLDPEHDALRLARVQERLGRYLWVSGVGEAAFAAYRRAVELLPDGPPSPTHARVTASMGQMLVLRSHGPDSAELAEAVSLCERAIEFAVATGAKTEEGRARITLGHALAGREEVTAGLAQILEGRGIAEAVGDVEDVGRSHVLHSIILVGNDRVAEGARDALDGLGVVQRLGLGAHMAAHLGASATAALFELGRWDEAERIASEGRRQGADGIPDLALRLVLAALRTGRGEYAAAREDLACAEQLVERGTGSPFYRIELFERRAELAIGERQPEKALAAVADGLRCARRARWVARFCCVGLRAVAEVACSGTTPSGRDAIVRQGEGLLSRARELAWDRAGEESILVGEALVRTCHAEQARILGVVDPDAWHSLAMMWESLGRPYRAAYAWWRRSEALVAAGAPRSDAEATARRVQRIALGLGARPILEELEALSRRARLLISEPAVEEGSARHTDERHASASRFALTARELEVLDLLQSGRTNAEIAHDLFISEKTASVHVSHILRKLGVRSRVDAAAAAHRLGLNNSAEQDPHRPRRPVPRRRS